MSAMSRLQKLAFPDITKTLHDLAPDLLDDQRQLFFARQFFNLHLASGCGRAIRAGLAKHQFDRCTGAGVFRRCPCVMRGEAFGEVVGDAAVQRVVGATQQIAKPGHTLP